MYNDDYDDGDEQRTIELLSVRSTNCVYGKAIHINEEGVIGRQRQKDPNVRGWPSKVLWPDP